MDILTGNNHQISSPQEQRSLAELELLRHLALIGELSDRREQLRTELAGIDQLLSQSRLLKGDLVQRVQELGGQLPSWQMP